MGERRQRPRRAERRPLADIEDGFAPRGQAESLFIVVARPPVRHGCADGKAAVASGIEEIGQDRPVGGDDGAGTGTPRRRNDLIAERGLAQIALEKRLAVPLGPGREEGEKRQEDAERPVDRE